MSGAGDQPMSPWVFVVQVESAARPGIVERVGRIFADRGISLTDLLATSRPQGSYLVLAFHATERVRDYLARRLGRVEEVASVVVRPADGRPPWDHLEAVAGPSAPPPAPS